MTHSHFSQILALAMSAACSSTALAVSLGSNITISDRNNDGSDSALAGSWYSDREDNETETNPGTINEQVWDLEGMYLNGSKLTLVGGFDFKRGTVHQGYTWKAGDLFIDIDADSAIYGQVANGGSGTTQYSNIKPAVTSELFGYDFVIDVRDYNGDEFNFDIVQLTPDSQVRRAADVASSNPWSYGSGGSIIRSGVGQYGLLSSLELPQGGLLGQGANNNHYYMTVDLASVPGIAGTSIFHYTLECGNDNLMGRTKRVSVPDSGSTCLLLFSGILPAIWLRQRLFTAIA